MRWRDLPDTLTTRRARASGVHPRVAGRRRDHGTLTRCVPPDGCTAGKLSGPAGRRLPRPAGNWLLRIGSRRPRPDRRAAAGRADSCPDSRPSALDHLPADRDIPIRLILLRARPIEHRRGTGEPVRVYDPARTVIDLMRLRHRLGEPVAHRALQRYLRRHDAQPAHLLRLATRLGVLGPVGSALDVATAG